MKGNVWKEALFWQSIAVLWVEVLNVNRHNVLTSIYVLDMILDGLHRLPENINFQFSCILGQKKFQFQMYEFSTNELKKKKRNHTFFKLEIVLLQNPFEKQM